MIPRIRSGFSRNPYLENGLRFPIPLNRIFNRTLGSQKSQPLFSNSQKVGYAVAGLLVGSLMVKFCKDKNFKIDEMPDRSHGHSIQKKNESEKEETLLNSDIWKLMSPNFESVQFEALRKDQQLAHLSDEQLKIYQKTLLNEVEKSAIEEVVSYAKEAEEKGDYDKACYYISFMNHKTDEEKEELLKELADRAEKQGNYRGVVLTFAYIAKKRPMQKGYAKEGEQDEKFVEMLIGLVRRLEKKEDYDYAAQVMFCIPNRFQADAIRESVLKIGNEETRNGPLLHEWLNKYYKKDWPGD